MTREHGFFIIFAGIFSVANYIAITLVYREVKRFGFRKKVEGELAVINSQIELAKVDLARYEVQLKLKEKELQKLEMLTKVKGTNSES